MSTTAHSRIWWIVAGNLAIVIPLAAILNVWQDEAYSLLTTTGSFAHMLHQAIFFEQNAPLYFVVLWLWRHISPAYFWARLLSVCCTTAMIALVPALVRRYVPGISAAWVTAAVAFNPLTIWAAIEIRGYALAMLLGTLLMLTAYDAFAKRSCRLSQLAAFVIVGTAAAYTQYFLLFIVAGYGGVLLATRAWRALARYTIACAAIVLLFLPMLLLLPAQMAAFRTAYTPPANLAVAFGQLARILLLQILPVGTMPHRGAITLVVVAAIVVAIVAGRRRFRGHGAYLPAVVLAASVTTYAVAVYVLKTHFDYRYGAFLFVPLLLALFSLFDWWDAPARQRGVAAFATLLLVLSAAALAGTYRSGAKIGDWQRVGSYLDTNVRGNAPIFIFEAENAIPLTYYYHGPARVVAIPTPVDFGSYDVDRFVVHSQDELRAMLRRQGNPAELWLVTAGTCHSLNVHYGCDLVEAYVNAHYRTLKERTFFHAKVRLLQRTGPA